MQNKTLSGLIAFNICPEKVTPRGSRRIGNSINFAQLIERFGKLNGGLGGLFGST